MRREKLTSNYTISLIIHNELFDVSSLANTFLLSLLLSVLAASLIIHLIILGDDGGIKNPSRTPLAFIIYSETSLIKSLTS
jgi:hypothetical protein